MPYPDFGVALKGATSDRSEFPAFLRDADIGLHAGFRRKVQQISGFLHQADGIGGAGGDTQTAPDTSLEIDDRLLIHDIDSFHLAAIQTCLASRARFCMHAGVIVALDRSRRI